MEGTISWLFCIIAIVLLYIVNLLLVACEISLVKFRYQLMESDEADGKLSGAAFALAQDGGRVASAIRFVLAVVAVALGFILHSLLVGLLAMLEEVPLALKWASYGVAFFVAVSSWYVFAELLPRSWALNSPEKSLRRSALWVRLVCGLLTPWVKLVNSVAKSFFGLGGVRFTQDFNLLDVEVQLRALGKHDMNLSPTTTKILRNGIRLNELVVSDVMLPRSLVQIFDLGDSLEENIAKAKAAGHTRYPLCEEDLDKCVGVIHIKDIFRYKGDLKSLELRKIKRDVISVGSEEPLENALNLLMQKKGHMALVLDDFGGAIGILTLENILEQLVGAIHDEFDAGEIDKVSAISNIDFKVDGLTPLHDLEERLEIEIENDEVSTFGGLITAELGRFPTNGEQVLLEEIGLALTIDEVDERRIISATVRKVPKAEPLDEEID